MAQASWPTPDNGHVVDDYQYERLGISYSVYAGQIGAPSATDVVYADSTGLQVKIRSGRYANLRGFTWYSGPTDFTKTISANSSGSTRIDMICLRLNRSTWNVTCEVINGTPGSGNPPALTQQTGSTGVWEFPLATVTVANSASTIAAGNVTPLPIFIATDGAGYLTYTSSQSALNMILGYVPNAYNGAFVTNLYDGISWLYTGSSWRNTTPDVQFFSSSGTWNKPAGAKWVNIQTRGGGGGGGSAQANAAGSNSKGGGGGEGGYSESTTVSTALSGSLSVTIGAGGAGGTPGNGGGDGGDTIVGSNLVVAKGGLGGPTANTSSAAFGCGGGAGGSTTGAVGDIKFGGAPGGPAWGDGNLGFSGPGGGAGGAKGHAFATANQTIAGVAGTLGGGGSGAMSTSGGGSNNGGAGGSGWVKITTYFV